MRLKTPRFWQAKGWFSTILLPASLLYALGHAIHQRLGTPYRSLIPVLCIGNLVAGGSGKTPVALALADLVRKHGIALAPVFLTRGYGGKLKGPVFVHPPSHSADDVGDEPLLLARKAPTIVAGSRKDGAGLAEQSGADLIIMDDGLHNTSLHKTLKIAVIDSATRFGNGRMLPAGPLRTPLKRGLEAVDAFIVVGDEILPLPPKPVFRARLESSWRPEQETKYLAFCGIGQPARFFRMLERLGADLAGKRTFPDHAPYTRQDLDMLAKVAARHNARLVTTTKDAERLPAGFIVDNAVGIVPVTMTWDDEPRFAAWLKTTLG